MRFWSQRLSSSHYLVKVTGSDMLGNSHRWSWEIRAHPHSPLHYAELACLTTGPADQFPASCLAAGSQRWSHTQSTGPTSSAGCACSFLSATRLVGDFFSEAPAPLSRPPFPSFSHRSVKSDSYEKSLILIHSSWLLPYEACINPREGTRREGRGKGGEKTKQDDLILRSPLADLSPSRKGPRLGPSVAVTSCVLVWFEQVNCVGLLTFTS